MRENRLAQGIGVVAAFQHGDHSSLADLLRDANDQFGHGPETFRGNFYIGQRIVFMRVKSRRDDYQVRLEFNDFRRQFVFHYREVIGVLGKSLHGEIKNASQPVAGPSFIARACARIKRILMNTAVIN